MNTQNTNNNKPAIDVKSTVTPVPQGTSTPAPLTPVTPGPAQAPSVAVVEAAAPVQLAKVGGEDLIIPPEVGEVMKRVGVNGSRALMTAKDWLLLKSGFTIASGKGKKLTAIKDQVGKDKAKLLLAEFNRKKVAYHIWSRRAAVLAASEPSMKQSTRVAMGKGNVVLGFDVKSRFVAATDSVLADENASLRAQLAALQKQLPAPAATA